MGRFRGGFGLGLYDFSRRQVAFDDLDEKRLEQARRNT
jgi:hypothetical protein